MNDDKLFRFPARHARFTLPESNLCRAQQQPLSSRVYRARCTSIAPNHLTSWCWPCLWLSSTGLWSSIRPILSLVTYIYIFRIILHILLAVFLIYALYTYTQRSMAYIVHNYIIMLKTVEDMDSIVDMMTRTRTWNPHGNFFIYIDCDLGADWNRVLQRFLQILWRQFVINVTFMFPDTQLYVNKVIKKKTNQCADVIQLKETIQSLRFF